jgi:hypothetical protein
MSTLSTVKKERGGTLEALAAVEEWSHRKTAQLDD